MNKYIPNIITALNLLSGCLGIIFAFEWNLIAAAWMVFLAALFDFLDGLSARLLNAATPMGKELDSLADIISFGLLPGLIIYQYLSYNNNQILPGHLKIDPSALVSLIIPLFAAIRLARFNTSSTEKNSFNGLAVPAAAMFFASIPLMVVQQKILFIVDASQIQKWISLPVTIYIITFFISFLMISGFSLMSLKFEGLSIQKNRFKYILIIFSVFWIVFFQFYSAPLILLSYFTISYFEYRSKKVK